MPQNPPEGYHTATPQSITPDPAGTLAFAEAVFGAKVYDKFVVDDVIIHAEFQIGDSRMMVGASNEEFRPYPSAIHIYVEDVDETYEAALSNGAISLRRPEDQFYGDRTAVVQDPQGNQWSMATHIEDLSTDEMHRRVDEMTA